MATTPKPDSPHAQRIGAGAQPSPQKPKDSEEEAAAQQETLTLLTRKARTAATNNAHALHTAQPNAESS